MCGIVGLHLTSPGLHPRLGELLSSMLEAMTTRGPDSAGLALYDAGHDAGHDAGSALRFSLRGAGLDWETVSHRLAGELGVDVAVEPRAGGAVLTCAAGDRAVLECLGRVAPDAVPVGRGHAMEIYKDVGAPREICERYGIQQRSGYQGLGHTRMATESAVTTDHSHPFAPAPDLALVHNGSFSNYATVRRRLAREGVHCRTDNDSEVAARFIARAMEAGADLGDALRLVLKEFDGFYTLLVTTRTQFAVVRDSFACKPAVVAETGDYVAVASEYQALAALPDIGKAEVFEPMPEEVHVWTR